MVRLFPDREYWQQLAGIYLALKRDERALTTFELAYRQGRLSREQDLLQLTQLYLGRGIPYKAARLLETEMERGRIGTGVRNLELLAGAWAAARERVRATAVYQRAMRAGGDAVIGLYLADLYIQDERWQEAAEVLEATLKRDGLSEPGDAWLLLGVAHYEEGSLDLARHAFDEAARFEPARTAAQDWLQHLQGQP
jgi:tetratricopeptide (TPR) repeat protein